MEIMMKKLILLFAFIPMLAIAEEPVKSEWLLYGKSGDNKVYEYKKASLEFEKNGDNPYVSVMFRLHTDTPNPDYIFNRLAITLSDCSRGEGTIVFFNTDQSVFGKYLFVFDGGTMGSSIAKSICDTAETVLKKMKTKETNPKIGI